MTNTLIDYIMNLFEMSSISNSYDLYVQMIMW